MEVRRAEFRLGDWRGTPVSGMLARLDSLNPIRGMDLAPEESTLLFSRGVPWPEFLALDIAGRFASARVGMARLAAGLPVRAVTLRADGEEVWLG